MSNPVESPAKNGIPYRIGNALLAIVTIAALSAVGIHLHCPPDPVASTASADAFSAERAIKHIQSFAQHPHSAGTQANAAVREYIKQQIAALGETPEIQEAIVNRQPGMASTIQNILARVKGTKNSRPIAMAAHYDSVPYGPGASDDGAGVATLLETIRAIKSGPPLQNDVIFVFTDAEEGHGHKSGLRGAAGFADQHPWAKEVGVLLNFDCRGTTGPAYMYETSAENGWLIDQLIAADCHPLGNSSSFDIADRMPTASDFTCFKKAGIAGYNMGFIQGVHRYHTRLDSIDHVDPASIQHFGSYALKLTKHLGGIDLANAKAPDAVYFNTLGSNMVRYPQSWAPRIAVLTAVLFLWVLILGFSMRRLTVLGLLWGVISFLLAALVVAGVTAGLVYIGYKQHGPYVVYVGDWIMAASAALAIGVMTLFAGSRHSETATYDRTMGAMFVWTVLAILAGFFMPGVSFLFPWPLIFSLLGLIFLMLHGGDVDSFESLHVGVTLLAAFPAILIVAPLFWAIYPAVTAVFSPALILLIVLLLGLLVPHLRLLSLVNRWWLPALSAIVFAGCVAMAAISFRYDTDHMKFTSATYALDADTPQAYWLSCDTAPDEWTNQFFPAGAASATLPEFLGDAPDTYLKTSAPVANLATPAVEVLEDAAQPDGRHLRLRVTSQRKAPRLVMFADKETKVLSTSVNGTKLQDVEGPWYLSYDVLPEAGIELALTVKPGSPVKLRLVDHSYELPEVPGVTVRPMPDYMAVRPNTIDFNRSPLKSNETLVAKTFTL